MSEGIVVALIGFAGAVLGAAIAGFAAITAAGAKKEGQTSLSCGLLGLFASLGAAGGLVLGALFGSTLIQRTMPLQSVPTQPSSTTPSPLTTPSLSKGRLLYEDRLDNSSGWNIEEGMAVENGNLVIWPGWDAVPQNPSKFDNFVFETRFYIPQSGSMAFYLRHQLPPCADWNCSVQIALYFNGDDQEIAARHFSGDKPHQQVDIKKARIGSLYPSNWNVLEVQAKGSDYAVYINGVFVFSFTDTAYASGAYIIDNAPNSSGEIKIDYLRFYQIP
ncbi:MAG: family 16 glycoside hydrolase [Methanothermobacter tenebrarum]|uniref:family 16 glycoside hydrolase n=1 Tax=Chloroflexus sp. TaxID=1904827 RepID=UPI003CAABC62